ncbi:hypothetical protein F5888DRAFT_1786441 [Russula emetica]|nr:hypothetical protein F5888DRAFT_1786441 [Russula emetica]
MLPRLGLLAVIQTCRSIHRTLLQAHLNVLLSMRHDNSMTTRKNIAAHKLNGLDFRPTKHKPGRHDAVSPRLLLVLLAPGSSAPMRATPPSHHHRAFSSHTQQGRHAGQSHARRLTR